MTRSSRWIALVALAGAAMAGAGCEKPLFPENQPRTQYDRYMALHGESRPMSQVGPYGGNEPNLRERLKPLDQD